MTRRLALVIVGVVVATLLLAGAGTLVLATVRARSTTTAELRTQAEDIAANLNDVLDIQAPLDTPEGKKELRQRLRLLSTMRQLMPIDDLTVLTQDASGQLEGGTLPAPLTDGDLSPALLANGDTVAGNRGRLAYAAAPVSGPNDRTWVVVVTRRIDAGLGASIRLFFWACAITILLGLGAAYWLGRRLSKPIRDASAATQQIAAGHLSTRVQQPRADQHDEVAELQRSINGMATSLERSRILEQQFLLSVSHDLRTPLTSIRGYAEAIADGNIDPTRAASVIHSESRRLERLVAHLLDLAKLQAHAFTFDLRRLDLSAAVHTAVDAAAAANTAITFHPVASGELPVQADPDRLAQALANLVENAGKFARTSVLVSTRAEHGRAFVTVDDDGPGIATHDLPHVFERLYTSRHEPQRQENSSGLGLAIVKELVEAMQGEVIAGTAPNGGARMSFWLPLVD